MSKQPNNSVHFLSEPPGGTHAAILAEITKPSSTPSSPAPASIIDISAPLARLEDAWRHVEACSQRIQDLESLVENLHKQEADLTAECDAAKRRCTELEAQISAEKQHSARAEGIAAAVSARANELEQALSDSNHNLRTLAGAVELALQGVPGRTETEEQAAA
jgi:chromosome segregation ATPase